ncbi:MAG: hypothetical protein K6A05_00670 [Lachnospiraceae bacterium]|nr:hypothetical protein [Lachnospiraceae bacterium]
MNEKKRPWNNCIWIVTLCLTLLLITVTLGVVVALPSPYEASYMGALQEKMQRLETTEGKRVIIIGGSAAAFGVDSSMLEACLNDTMPTKGEIQRPDDLVDSNRRLHAEDTSGAISDVRVVNLGMYGGLGTRVMLELANPKIHSGDIVILMPEMNAQSYSSYFGPSYYLQGLGEHPKYFLCLSDQEKGQVIGTMPQFAVKKLRSLQQKYQPAPTEVYQRSSFNQYGDVDTVNATVNVMPDGVDTVTPVDFSRKLLEGDFVTYSNAFAKKWQKRGATVYYAYCPVNAAAISEEGQLQDFHRQLQDTLQYPILGTPEESVLDIQHFYDTNFHLNRDGRAYYTYGLLRNLKASVGDSRYTISPREWLALREEQPAEAVRRTLVSKAASEVTDLVWEKTAQGIRITGLTSEGLSRPSIDLPEAIDEVPVIAVADGIFAEAKELQEIHVQVTSPEQMTVGQGFLDGTDAKVYVPAASLEGYQLNYFWSTYGDQLYGE